jgi:hypothetical protein
MIVRWIEEKSRWSKLRELGQSGLVRSSVLMPAFGYILLLNENAHQYLTIRFDDWLLQYMPSTWRIWVLFYKTFFLAVASVLFSVFCPREIRRYATEYEIADALRDHVNWQGGRQEDLRRIVGNLYERMSQFESSIFDLFDFFNSHVHVNLRPSKRFLKCTKRIGS